MYSVLILYLHFFLAQGNKNFNNNSQNLTLISILHLMSEMKYLLKSHLDPFPGPKPPPKVGKSSSL